MSQDELSQGEARRLALAAQGFDRPRPAGGGDAAHVRRVLRQLGVLQLDYVNVLVPAHYQVLFSRLGPYEKAHLDDLVYRRRAFTEQWAHEASILPVESWPLLRYRMEAHRVPDDTRAELQGMGHRFETAPRLGDAHSIWVDPETGEQHGAADVRIRGHAAGN